MYREDFIKKGMVYIDRVTGVNYVVIERGNQVAITPRLNADGTLFITGKEELEG